MAGIYDDFEQYISAALESLCEFMNVDKTALSFKVQRENVNGVPQKTNWIHTQTFLIQINQSVSLWLTQIAKDVAIEKIERSTVFLSVCGASKSKWRICDLAAASPLESKALATLLYQELKETLERRCYKLLGFEVNWIDRLSLMRYEGDSLVGRIILECSNADVFKNVKALLRPQINSHGDGLELNDANRRQICKLMAGSGSDALLFHRGENRNSSYQCMGYVSKEKLGMFPYYIEITGALEWTLYAFGKAEFHYSYDKPQALPDSTANLLRSFVEEFGSNSTFDNYRNVLSAIAKQKHGTSAIFVNMSDDGSTIMNDRLEILYQMKRALKGDGLCIADTANAQIWTDLARMDGAFVADINTGKLLYLSVIVDGQACIEGNTARGARYNSLKNFVADVSRQTRQAGKMLKAIAVIFSEDGCVDIVKASALNGGVEDAEAEPAQMSSYASVCPSI